MRRYHRVLFFGKNKETDKASNCHAWTKTKGAGLSLLSDGMGFSFELEDDDFSVEDVSHMNKDCVAHIRSC